MAENKFLSLTGLQTYDELIKGEIQEVANDVATNTSAITTLNGSDTTAGSVAKAVKDASDAINVKIGDTEELDTTAKILVDALNEVRQSVSAGGTAAAITITSDTTTEGMAKSYTVKQVIAL